MTHDEGFEFDEDYCAECGWELMGSDRRSNDEGFCKYCWLSVVEEMDDDEDDAA